MDESARKALSWIAKQGGSCTIDPQMVVYANGHSAPWISSDDLLRLVTMDHLVCDGGGLCLVEPELPWQIRLRKRKKVVAEKKRRGGGLN